MSIDLSVISTDQLLAELVARFDNVCFIGAKDDYKGPGKPQITIHSKGIPDRVGALCLDAAVIISPGIRDMLE